MINMTGAIDPTGWNTLWWEEQSRRLRARFVAGSVLLHLLLALLLIKGAPELFHAHHETVSPPMTVTLLDPDVVKELPIGPTTHLPPKPKNLLPAPFSRLAPAPTVRPLAPSSRTDTAVPDRGVDHATGDVGLPPFTLPPAAGHESSSGSAADHAPMPPSAGSIPGLPFVTKDEINQEVAKLFSDQPKSKEPYQVNTEDLQYLSYIAQIARTLEMIWKYPREAGERGQEGQTVIKIVIMKDGTLAATELMQSSGYSLLDGEALRVVKRLAPYPPLPLSWHRSEWDLTISFTYVLNGVNVNVI